LILKRGKGYGVRVYRGGRQEWVGTFERLQDARAAERKALERHGTGRETCDAFAGRWPRDYPRPAAATERTYRYALGAFVHDFAGVRLDDVDRPRARAWALAQPKGNVYVVRSMFSDAVRDGLCAANPFSQLRLEGSRGRRDLVALTELELNRLADVALEVHATTARPSARWSCSPPTSACGRPSSSRSSTTTSTSRR
jgi:hypothetical protein